MKKMTMDFIEQTRNAMVPVVAFAGEAVGAFSLDSITKVAVLLYTLLQAGFLVWRWGQATKKKARIQHVQAKRVEDKKQQEVDSAI